MFQIHKGEYINKTFRLERTLVEDLSRCAAAHQISVNDLVTQCCRYALENLQKEQVSTHET